MRLGNFFFLWCNVTTLLKIFAIIEKNQTRDGWGLLFGSLLFWKDHNNILSLFIMPYCVVARLVLLTEWLRSCMADSSLISMIWRWSFASGHLLTHAKKIIIAERNFLNSFLKNINDNGMQSSHANHSRNLPLHI